MTLVNKYTLINEKIKWDKNLINDSRINKIKLWGNEHFSKCVKKTMSKNIKCLGTNQYRVFFIPLNIYFGLVWVANKITYIAIPFIHLNSKIKV